MLIDHILRRNCSKLSPQSSTLIRNAPGASDSHSFPTLCFSPVTHTGRRSRPYSQRISPIRPILTSDGIPRLGRLYGARGFSYCRAACSELFSGPYTASRSINLSSFVSFGPSLGPSPSSNTCHSSNDLLIWGQL